jgi:uncharacterized protein YcgI (DUF1989 family)
MTGHAWRVAAGAVVRVIDLEGSQVADVFLVDAEDLSDGLSGDALELRAERDLLVAVSACSASGANGGGARPLGVEVLTAP